MVGLVGMTITCLITSFVTDYKYVIIAAWMTIPHTFFNATEDVALDALSLK